MCGISTVVTFRSPSGRGSTTGHKTLLQSSLHRSLDEIRYRGSDDRGIWISRDKRVGLGHVRTAIVDPTPQGRQPFYDAASGICVVVNGEIYNYKDIREQYSSTYSFTSMSDSEVVIPLYKELGPSFLLELRGEFSLCLYDSRQRLFFVAVDPHATKSLFWTVTGDRLLVASAQKAFQAWEWEAVLDEESMYFEDWIYNNRTFFRDVHTMAPGTYLTCSATGNIKEHKWWNMAFPSKLSEDPRTDAEMIQGVRMRLIDSVQVRLPQHGSIAVLLSGGKDSSIIAGIVRHLLGHSTRELVCFTVSFSREDFFDADQYNEAGVAQRTASALGARLVVVEITGRLLVETFAETTRRLERPTPNFDSACRRALAQAVEAEGIKVVLTGSGADDIFGGYPAFFPDRLKEPDHSCRSTGDLEARAANQMSIRAQALASSIPRGFINRPNDDCESDEKASRMLHNAYIASTTWSDRNVHPPYSVEMIKPNQKVSAEQRRALRISVDQRRNMRDHHPLHIAIAFWMDTVLPATELSALNDAVGMPVECRYPYLDSQLVEYVNQLPPNIKIRYSPKTGVLEPKYVLAQAGKPFMLDEVFRRPKHAFSAPRQHTPTSPWHLALKRLITQENLESLIFLDASSTLRLLECAEDPAVATTLTFVAGLVVLCQLFGNNQQ